MDGMYKSRINTIYIFISCIILAVCLLAGCSSENTPKATVAAGEKTITSESNDSDGASEASKDFGDERALSADEGTDESIEPPTPDVGVQSREENTEARESDSDEVGDGTASDENTSGTGENDAGVTGNEEVADVTPEPLPDTTPPVFKEYRSHLVYIGDTVSYRSGVILTDDSGEEPVLTIDSSKVNLKEAGEYPLTYTATDAAGNTAVCEVTVVVREREDVTQEMLDAKADEIIEELLGDSDRDIEALEKLFKWTKKNIHYVNYFEQKDDISAAWEGLMYERGDCYVYACASKELLTRSGFKNDMIRTARHYWNLVDLGEGWYHYDTCPRKDKPYFFMWGDEQLMEYSKANGNSHDYDHTKWPDVMP